MLCGHDCESIFAFFGFISVVMKRFNDYLESARRRLPHFLFEYINGGAYDEVTLRANLSRLAATTLRQRAMKDVSVISTQTKLVGREFSLPVVLGPVGFAGMMARRGEIQGARAAERTGIPYCMSTYSICSISEVRTNTSSPFWFQLNMFKDRGLMTELLREAATHCSTLIFNCDLAVLGTRYSDFRSGLVAPGMRGHLWRFLQAASRPSWSWDVGLCGRPHVLGNIQPYLNSQGIREHSSTWTKRNLDPSTTWSDLTWIRNNWSGPLIIKGILDPDDAQSALDLGANGIVVSNHGGRQLDSALATAEALPPIAERMRGRITVFVDGGVRSGIDVLKMLNLGADGVFLGRAWVTALAARGEEGVVTLLDNIGQELRVAMAMTGCTKIDEARLVH